MFKKIADLFAGGGKPSQRDLLIKQIKDEFKGDYLDNPKTLGGLPEDVTEMAKATIKACYEAIIKPQEYPRSGDPIRNIFGAINYVSVLIWLEKYGYGEKLAIKQSQLTYRDDYGDVNYQDWERELEDFVSRKKWDIKRGIEFFIPDKYKKYAQTLNMENDLLVNEYPASEMISGLVDLINLNLLVFESRISENYSPSSLDEIEDPYEYEKAVSQAFSRMGWNSYATSGSGDQGADVIAEKAGVKLVVQCKLYSDPVGNKSVQEVAAATRFYHGNLSAVVSNQNYTKSAKQLAESLGVYLLHHTQLTTFDQSIFGNEDDEPYDDFDEEFDEYDDV